MSVDILGPDGFPIKRADPGVELTRRSILGLFGAVAGSVALPSWAQEAPAFANDFWLRPRRLNLRHAGGERLDIVYWSDGEVISPAWEEVSWFMRDRVDRKAVYMHPVLLDILYGMCGWLDYFGIREPLGFNSGYRTVGRNAKTEGAVLDSEHTKGGAGDVHHPAVSSTKMARVGVWLGGGGVGWYPNKGFTHVDRGRLRVWRG